MDETTTDVVSQEQALDAQPVEQHTEAVQDTTTEPTTTDPVTEEPAQAANSTEQESKTFTPEWLTSKGIDPNDPEAFQKVANMAFNAEKQMTRTQQQASELQKQMATQPLEQRSEDPLVQEALAIAHEAKTEITVERWKAAKGITPQQDDAMGKYIQANPDKGYLLKNNYLTLDDIYAMSGVGRQDTAQIKAQGGQEALETLANKQRATAVSGNATSTAPPAQVTAANADQWWDSLGSAGRADPANRAKLDSLMG